MRTSMRAAIATTMAILAASEAFAQQGRRGGVPRGAETTRPVQQPLGPRRGVPFYDQPGSGIIRWNTPNSDGNFGTPSGGGGAGAGP